MDEKEMMDEEKRIERGNKMSLIATLVNSLDSPTSDIGDWKVVKIYEARLNGEADPYDYTELSAKRQAVRDRINALQTELGEENN